MIPLLQNSPTPDSILSDGSIALTELDLYPESDGKPMAENTEQYRWIVILKENLEILFAAVVDVFIAADLLWYPVEASKPIPEDFTLRSQAPDVMVIFGCPKGKRGSYKQWQEEQIAPQVVFEILSPSNITRKGIKEMKVKFEFYQKYGVEEYYIYDPETYELRGWLRQGQKLEPIANLQGWISPRLGIRFAGLGGQELEVYYPDGRKFVSSIELAALAEGERQRAEVERQKAEVERQRAEGERQQKELAQQGIDRAAVQIQQAVVRLLQGGMAIAQVAQIMSLSEIQVQEIRDRN
jgi:Uma2 family endonuclease